MCGIAGIMGFNYTPNEEIIREMTNTIAHRGPDGEGIWIDESKMIGLGHRRLAIIDLSDNGKQPMHYLNKYVITFNGEIYNYIEIKEYLKQKGYSFTTKSDTEVVMAAYDHWKENCLKEFDGMFSFAIFDKEKEELFCARDRFGEKPFYYSIDENKLSFASEMKALWKIGIPKTINSYSVYLLLNFNLEENPENPTQTFFKSIFKLKKGHYFKFKKGDHIIQKQYWAIDNTSINTSISFEEASKKFKQLFFDSVQLRLRSDVPVGTSLSGGLDSSSVVLAINNMLDRNNTEQKTFSARFDDNVLDEGYFMNKVIEGKNIKQFCTYPDPKKMIEQMGDIMYHQEEPFGSASIFAQWEVYKLAKKEEVIVLQDGQGADEYLAGYTHFFEPFFREILRTKGNKYLKKVVTEVLNNNAVNENLSPNIIFKIEAFLPDFFKNLRILKRNIFGVRINPDIDDELYRSFCNTHPPFPYFSNLNTALQYYTFNYGLERLLRYADRNSMASSIEVRLPFLNHKLVEFVFSLPSEYKIHQGWTKGLLRYGMQDILPKEITWRKNKLGFEPPQKRWFQNKDWKDWAFDYHNVSIRNNWVDKNSLPSWRSTNLGVFENMLNSY